MTIARKIAHKIALATSGTLADAPHAPGKGPAGFWHAVGGQADGQTRSDSAPDFDGPGRWQKPDASNVRNLAPATDQLLFLRIQIRTSQIPPVPGFPRGNSDFDQERPSHHE